jgi:hypothetical protein
MRPHLLPLALCALLAACGGAGSSYSTWDAWGGDAEELESTGAVRAESVVLTAGSAPRARSGGRASGAMAPPPMQAAAPAPAMIAQADGAPPMEPPDDPQADSRPTPLLIYTAQMTLAIYDVAATQDAALAAVEAMGGYASERSTNYVVFRVPAERFREALDTLDDLGDVLSLDWQASDVSEQYRDLDIRLANALEMRGRLQALLDRATDVEDMLYIEQQLERITLQIEQLRGALRVLSDQIAYSTITVSFSRLTTSDVPTHEFRLPFPWLQTLGLERLLSM